MQTINIFLFSELIISDIKLVILIKCNLFDTIWRNSYVFFVFIPKEKEIRFYSLIW